MLKKLIVKEDMNFHLKIHITIQKDQELEVVELVSEKTKIKKGNIQWPLKWVLKRTRMTNTE